MLQMGIFSRLFGKPSEKETEKMAATLKIGIILGSTRQGRVSPQLENG